MLSYAQYELLKREIEESHVRDLQALEQIKRFFLAEKNPLEASISPLLTPDPNARLLESGSATVMSGIERRLRSEFGRTWTAQQLKVALENEGFQLSPKSPVTTISVSLKKLCDRGSVTLVRRGSGREPHIYQWRTPTTAECEAIAENSTNEMIV